MKSKLFVPKEHTYMKLITLYLQRNNWMCWDIISFAPPPSSCIPDGSLCEFERIKTISNCIFLSLFDPFKDNYASFDFENK